MAPTSSKKNIPPTRPKSSLKRWIGGVLALILILGVILSQIDLESVKENLIQKVSDETGMKVAIDSIGFGFSRGLGLQCKGVKVSTPTGDNYSVDRLDLLAAWSPLLKGEFKIKSAALQHPVIKLEIPEPSPESPPEPPKEDKKPSAESTEPGIVDSETIHSTTEKLKNTPLSVDQFIISDGEITLTRSGKQLPLNLDGTFVLNQGERLDISAKALKVQTGSIILEGDGMVSNMTADDGRISLNLKTGGFSLKEIQSILQFFGKPMQQTPLEAVDLDKLVLKAEMPLNSLSKIEVLKKQMTGHIEFEISNVNLKTPDSYSIETLEGEGDWADGVLTHDFKGTVLGTSISLNGKLPFADLAKDSVSRIEWKGLDLKKLPLKKGMAWSPAEGIVSGSLSLTGPLPAGDEKPKLKAVVDFQAEGLVLKPKSPNKPIAISHLQGHGDFNQGQLQHEIHGVLWGSEFDIKGKLNTANPALNTTLNWKGLDIAQLPLPPSTGWQPTEGKLSGTLTLAGPAPKEGESFPGKLKGSLKFDAQNLKLTNANSPPLTLSHLEGSGDIANKKVNYKLNTDIFNGTISSGGDINLATTPVLDNQTTFTNIDLSQLPRSATGKTGHVSGTVKLKGPLPDPENILTSNLKIDTTFKITDLKMSAGTIPLDVKTFDGKASLQQGKLTHDLNGTLFGGTVKTKGSLIIHQGKKQTLITADSDLALDHVNLDWAPLINKSAPSSGTVTANLKIKGPLPSTAEISPKLKLTGTFTGEKLVLENRQIEKVVLTFKESTAKSRPVVVEMEKINLGDKKVKKLKAQFEITPEKIDLTRGEIWPMNGLIQLAGNFEPPSGNYRLRFKGEKLKVEDLTPHIKGPLQFSGAVVGTMPKNTKTPELPDYARDLSGDIKIALVDGAIPELGTLEGLLTLLNPTTALNAQKGGLGYDYLGGDLKIVKGVVHTENLELRSSQLNMNVVGKANLVEDSVLAQVKAMPLQMLDKTIKAIPLLGQILGGGKKGGILEIYVKVSGKLSDPSYIPLPHKSLTEKPGQILEGLFNNLQKK